MSSRQKTGTTRTGQQLMQGEREQVAVLRGRVAHVAQIIGQPRTHEVIVSYAHGPVGALLEPETTRFPREQLHEARLLFREYVKRVRAA